LHGLGVLSFTSEANIKKKRIHKMRKEKDDPDFLSIPLLPPSIIP
jgi:hypothetical protein